MVYSFFCHLYKMKKIGKSINLYNEEDRKIDQSLQLRRYKNQSISKIKKIGKSINLYNEEGRKKSINQSSQLSHLADQSQTLHGLVGLCHVLGGHAVRVGDELLLASLVLLGLLLLLRGGHAHGHRLGLGVPSVLRILIHGTHMFLDPDPDPLVRDMDRIRIHRTRMFLGLPDPNPDPLVRDMEPDPDP